MSRRRQGGKPEERLRKVGAVSFAPSGLVSSKNTYPASLLRNSIFRAGDHNILDATILPSTTYNKTSEFRNSLLRPGLYSCAASRLIFLPVRKGFEATCLEARAWVVPSGGYSAASFVITTFRCVVTSLCSFTGTVNSPMDFSGSWSWILRRSMLKLFFSSASAMSPAVTDPKS